MGRKFLCTQMQGQMGPARGWAQEVGRGDVLLSRGSGFVPKGADAVSLLCVCSQDSQRLSGEVALVCVRAVLWGSQPWLLLWDPPIQVVLLLQVSQLCLGPFPGPAAPSRALPSFQCPPVCQAQFSAVLWCGCPPSPSSSVTCFSDECFCTFSHTVTKG